MIRTCNNNAECFTVNSNIKFKDRILKIPIIIYIIILTLLYLVLKYKFNLR